MKNRKKIVMGNWKMHVAIVPEAKKIVQTVKRKTAKVKKTEIVFCPPAIYLQALAPMMKGRFKLGVQNVFQEESGAYTGEVAAVQMRQFGVSYVLVGHSERRKIGETDEVIGKKVQAVLKAHMSPVLCIGESVHDDEGHYLQFIKNQLVKALTGVSKAQISDVVIAYEPIWAVGGKAAMDPRHVHEMSLYIKKCLRDMFGEYASGVSILYGGDATVQNAQAIVAEGFVDGLLVGRESLNADDFSEIVREVDAVK